ncbi:putative gustatory receptor 59d, partial [Drosophila novamexicana]|uniref:putative gustatory receptor 59d n=1 Tax=Drosophila novamexicana TaxID=47314 RepID=UPI0011E58EA9
MFELVRCLLRVSYYYALLVGVLNFEIDLRTGRAHITRRTSIYAACVNVICICGLPWLSGTHVIHSFWTQAELLHDYMFLVMLSGRVLCVSVTLISRWSQRRRFVRLVNSFQHLTQQKPHVMRMWRRGVISKFISVILSDFLQMAASLLLIWEKLTIKLSFSVMIFYAISALVNIIISHYYFALLNVYGQYILLNRELRAVLAETRSLESECRKGTLLLTISYYMSGVSMIYLGFSELTGAIRLNWSKWVLALLGCGFICYFTDIHISVNIIYALLDAHAEMVKLLSQHTLFGPGLDERLAAVFDSFQIQLAWNPVKFSVLGLYDMEKSNAVTLASSVVTSSLVLIQNDLKNA